MDKKNTMKIKTKRTLFTILDSLLELDVFLTERNLKAFNFTATKNNYKRADYDSFYLVLSKNIPAGTQASPISNSLSASKFKRMKR